MPGFIYVVPNCLHTEVYIYEMHTLISVLVVPRIAPPIQNLLHTNLKHLSHVTEIGLVHPVTDDKNFELSILIGADYLDICRRPCY